MATSKIKETSRVARKRTPQWAKVGAPAPATVDGADERYHSRAVERALDALESFGMDTASRSLKEIAAKTGQPESSLYRILTTLLKRDYILQNRDGTYQLSSRVLYGFAFEAAERLRKMARPFLEDLARRFDETASLAYLFADHIQVLDTVETFHAIRVTNRIGRILPPHCSAMGKVILAFQEGEAADRLLETYGLVPRTEYTISDRHHLKMALEQARVDGYAVDRQESSLGGTCYGAPIVDAEGRVIAAVSMSTPIQRLTETKEADIRDGVKQTAAAISEGLGAAKTPDAVKPSTKSKKR